jgi:glycosyltransferase involved in cell wall biosynthesis
MEAVMAATTPRAKRPAVSASHNADAWLVIPLFNEAQVIGDVVAEALKTFPNIVCVDDGSSDGSEEIAERAGARVVRHPVNFGQGAALQTGFDYVLRDPAAQFVVTFDSDGQHRVEDADAMVARLREGNLDVVLGSRFLDSRTKPGLLKSLVLKVAVVMSNLTTGVRLTDAHNGLRAFTREGLSAIRITQDRMAHASEIVAEIGKAGLRFAEHPVHIVYTDYSRSKGQSLWNSVNILAELLFK